MKRLLLIINPVAGKLTVHTELFAIINKFCRSGYEVTTAVSQKRGNMRELAEGAKDKGYDLVVCCGGDGSLNETVSGLITSGNGKAPLPLGYIPCGSTNDFAETLQIYLKPHIAAMQIVEGKPLKLDVGQFGENRFFTYIASFGAFTSASYSANQELKNTLGHFAYLLAGLNDLSSLRGHKVKVSANGKTYSGNYIFGSVSNTTSVAGLVKFKDTIVDLSDGKFEVILIKKPADIIDLNKIIAGIANSDFSSDAFDYFKSDTINFEMGKSIPWTLDGEKADAPGDITIKNLNKALTLIR